MITMDRSIKQSYQELLVHPGWELFKGLVFRDVDNGVKVKKCLKSQIQDKLSSAVRANEWENVAKYQGQLDILDVIVKLPENEFKRA